MTENVLLTCNAYASVTRCTLGPICACSESCQSYRTLFMLGNVWDLKGDTKSLLGSQFTSCGNCAIVLPQMCPSHVSSIYILQLHPHPNVKIATHVANVRLCVLD